MCNEEWDILHHKKFYECVGIYPTTITKLEHAYRIPEWWDSSFRQNSHIIRGITLTSLWHGVVEFCKRHTVQCKYCEHNWWYTTSSCSEPHPATKYFKNVCSVTHYYFHGELQLTSEVSGMMRGRKEKRWWWGENVVCVCSYLQVIIIWFFRVWNTNEDNTQ